MINVLVMLIVLALVPTRAPAASSQIFFENFDGELSGNFSGVTTTSGVQGFSAFGFSGTMLWNTSGGDPAEATILTLTGLPTHNSIDINFLFGAIDSWDGLSTSYGPDYFNVEVDGVLVFHREFPNAVNVPLTPPPFTDLAGNTSWADIAYDLGLLKIPHTASSLTIKFFASGGGWQGYPDESWAIDNLKVRVNSVTAPLSDAILLLIPLKKNKY